MAQGLFNLKQQLQGLIRKAWSGSQTTPYVEYLVVAGGGGAGADGPGGGGAGGVLQGISNITAGTSITVTIGSGGSGTSGSTQPTNGLNSVFGSITAIGGGKGANSANPGGSGGSGGGAGILYSGYNTPAGQGTFGQGNAGGQLTTAAYSGGGATSGGGGAGTIGVTPGVYNAGGNGGAGIASAISGTLTGYGGGGAGCTGNIGSGYTTAVGGFGGGGSSPGGNGGSGTANTGGGGGAGPSYTGGSGGSGIVIISYPDIYNAPASFGGANSPTASTSGSGSLSFNGTNQYVYYPNNSNLNLSTGSWTIEFWIYTTSAFGSYQTVLSKRGSGVQYEVGLTPSGYVYFYSGTVYASSTAVTLNTWQHVACTYDGTNLRLFLNGVVILTQASVTAASGTDPLTIGAVYSVGSYYGGYVSNCRILKGTALYTANFTPPTAPLTPIANTQFLLSTVSPDGYNESSANALTPTLNGTPSWNQLSPFATGLGYKNRVYTWTGSGTVTF